MLSQLNQITFGHYIEPFEHTPRKNIGLFVAHDPIFLPLSPSTVEVGLTGTLPAGDAMFAISN